MRRATTRIAPANATTTWARLRTLFHAVSGGDAAWGVYAYNGALFAVDEGLPGAELLEHAEARDEFVRDALVAIGFDDEAADVEAGVDYGGLDVGHLGAIYEGLLALRLSRATEPLGWDRRRKRYVPQAEPGPDGVDTGQLFFQTEAGGRKGGGVYYTPQLLVRHLVNHSVIPALDEHLREIADLRGRDPAAAARRLFEFRVLDPAMGSAHFLADALDRMADHYARFLAEHSLPGVRDRLDALRREAEGAERVEDAQLLRRLILKRCLYGVDLSPMAVEIGRVSLWLKSFVPGMALSYLGHNLQVAMTPWWAWRPWTSWPSSYRWLSDPARRSFGRSKRRPCQGARAGRHRGPHPRRRGSLAAGRGRVARGRRRGAAGA